MPFSDSVTQIAVFKLDLNLDGYVNTRQHNCPIQSQSEEIQMDKLVFHGEMIQTTLNRFTSTS